MFSQACSGDEGFHPIKSLKIDRGSRRYVTVVDRRVSLNAWCYLRRQGFVFLEETTAKLNWLSVQSISIALDIMILFWILYHQLDIITLFWISSFWFGYHHSGLEIITLVWISSHWFGYHSGLDIITLVWISLKSFGFH